jgi:hypothetical protein
MRLDRLIKAAHGLAAATAFKQFQPTDADIQALAEVGKEVLQYVPPEPSACALMAAVYALKVCDRLRSPPYVVAGSLSVGDVMIYGGKAPGDPKVPFTESSSSWDGHAWLAVGHLLADVSIFRTAYSEKAHPLLSSHVKATFGEGRGLLVAPFSELPRHGLYYTPQRVLSETEVSALYRGAQARYSPKSMKTE